jgi:hypothetical protein
MVRIEIMRRPAAQPDCATYPFKDLRPVGFETPANGLDHRAAGKRALALGKAFAIPMGDEPHKHISRARKRYRDWKIRAVEDRSNRVMIVWREK